MNTNQNLKPQAVSEMGINRSFAQLIVGYFLFLIRLTRP